MNNETQNLLRQYIENGEYQEAINILNKEIELDKKNAYLHAFRGAMYCEMGRLIESIEDLNLSIDLDANCLSYIERGCAYLKLEQYEEALKDFNIANKFDEKHSELYLGRGQTYYFLGKYSAAIKDLNKAIELGEKNTLAYYFRGSIFFKQKKYIKGLKDFSMYYENVSDFITTSIQLRIPLKDIEKVLFSARGRQLWQKDFVFNSIIGKKKTGKNFEKIWFYQAIILSILAFKPGDGDVSHYTSYEAFKFLIGFKNANTPPTSMKMNSLSTANDPNEGSILSEVLKKEEICIEQNTAENLVALQTSFTKNEDSLTMFRLYGKKEHKEATGVSLVFDYNFFSLNLTSNLVSLVPSLVSNGISGNETQKRSLFYVLYYDKSSHSFVFNRKNMEKHGQNFYVYLTQDFEEDITIDDIDACLKDNDWDGEKTVKALEYCFFKIFEIIKQSKNKQICYNLLINLRYLIKSDAWLEESELRLIEIADTINLDGELKIDYDSGKLYKDYNLIFPYLRKIILGSKIENVGSKKESIKRHLLSKGYGNIKVTISEAPMS